MLVSCYSGCAEQARQASQPLLAQCRRVCRILAPSLCLRRAYKIIEATNGLPFPTGFPIQSTAVEGLFCGACGLATPIPPQIYPYFGLLLGSCLACKPPRPQSGRGGVEIGFTGEEARDPSEECKRSRATTHNGRQRRVGTWHSPGQKETPGCGHDERREFQTFQTATFFAPGRSYGSLLVSRWKLGREQGSHELICALQSPGDLP